MRMLASLARLRVQMLQHFPGFRQKSRRYAAVMRSLYTTDGKKYRNANRICFYLPAYISAKFQNFEFRDRLRVQRLQFCPGFRQKTTAVRRNFFRNLWYEAFAPLTAKNSENRSVFAP